MMVQVGSREYYVSEKLQPLEMLLGFEVALKNGMVGHIGSSSVYEKEKAIVVELDDLTIIEFLVADYIGYTNIHSNEYDVVKIITPQKRTQ